ncbi:ABC-type uncharacterized transport system substrate-binding protein [Microvirga flocculans]|uniref:ABC-type uncharacterized transport system substrate-binding protein n=1 Tax=Microvirga flocculans TaxID=217168 RepID=A0A7W6N8V1_9HYPH|nr:DUF1007 family protein [Microvirga flocculans]MBB4041041.1 ABC-type uncharacterized transport system substrate-binding protein [Microvirga flocculans]
MAHRFGLKSSLVALSLGLGWGLASPALAHPHVWVTAKAEIVFAQDGLVTGVRHHWTFDEAYTAYVTQGLDANGDGKLTPEELQGLADENAASLNEFEYFTVLKARGRPQAFDPPREARMSMEKTQVAMSFFLPLKTPVTPSGAVSIEIEDPSFFVYFSLEDGNAAISLANAPQGCVTNVAKAKPLDAAMQKILQDEGAIQGQPNPGFGIEYSNRAIVACP